MMVVTFFTRSLDRVVRMTVNETTAQKNNTFFIRASCICFMLTTAPSPCFGRWLLGFPQKIKS